MLYLLLQANSLPLSSIPTSTPPELFVFPFSTKRNHGNLLSLLNRLVNSFSFDPKISWNRSLLVLCNQILLGVQELLDTPNADDPAQLDAYTMFKFVLSLSFFPNIVTDMC